MCRDRVPVLIFIQVGECDFDLIWCVILGAGSGEFHVYKQNRRREYERVKLMEDISKKVSM